MPKIPNNLCCLDPPVSTHVQLISARAPVQVSTEGERNLLGIELSINLSYDVSVG